MSKQAPLMLSVSGMRGLVGQSITPTVVASYAAAFGAWLRESTKKDAPHVVIGRVSRPSGKMFEMAAVSGLIASGCRVTRVGILSTPGVAIMIGHHKAEGGMVITASHNPIIWNGVKALRHDGAAPPADQAMQIIQRFKDNKLKYDAVDKLQPCGEDNTGVQVHTDSVLPHIDVDAVRTAKLTAVVDSVNGAGGDEAKALLEALGVKVIHMYPEPTGLFPHTPEPTRENLTELCAKVKETGAAIGFAQDPDADRLAVVDDLGNYIGEEYTLSLSAMHLLGKGDTAVANLSTSRMIDDIADKAGAKVLRTAVGEANVVAGMAQSGSTIGGEGNGGVIWPKVSGVRDSIVGMAILLEMLAKRGKPLSELIKLTPAYAIVKDKVDASAELISKISPILKDAFKGQKIDTQDGVRIDWPDRWVHVRPSNTEPIVRLIAEAGNEKDAAALIAQVREALGLA
ncbi:MAG: phosphoglucosamine mutase [Phycisphaerales bacterium]